MATKKSRAIDPEALDTMNKMDEMFKAANSKHSKKSNEDSAKDEQVQNHEPNKQSDEPKKDKEEKQDASISSPNIKERRAGRPRARTFSKEDSSRLFIVIPNDLKATLESCAFYAKKEQSEIVRTALWYFFNKYADASGSLVDGGVRQIEKYVDETTKK